MKIESIRAVKAQLNQIVAELPAQGSVVITKNGHPCAVLLPVTDDKDLEVLTVSQSKRFWKLFDKAVTQAETVGWTALDDL